MDKCANESPQSYEDLQQVRENIVLGDLSTLSVVGTEKFKFYIEKERPIFICHSILEKTRAGVMNQIPTEELYKYKGTLVGNNSKVSAIVNLLDFTDIPVHSISLQTNNKPYGITVNYKVDSRADYRFFDYASFDKNAAVISCLIPNADDLENLKQWQGGDIVTIDKPQHIAIISDKRNAKGVPYVIHNMGPIPREEDCMENWNGKITGHFRYPKNFK